MGSVKSVSFEKVEQAAVESLVFGSTIPGKVGWVATIELEDGGRLVADKLADETCWLVNGEWAPNCSMPKFWNGQLSRCTLPIVLSDELTEVVERNFMAHLYLVVEANRTSLR